MGQLVFQATLGGQVNLIGPNTASTYNINVPIVNGNLVTTGDTATVTNAMISGPVDVNKGGTGQSTYTNGQLLIGNTTGNTLAKSTLTAGTGISITNGAGAITITNTNANDGPTLQTFIYAPLAATYARGASQSGTYARTSPSTTLTVTKASHGFLANDTVYLDFTSGTAVDGWYTVTSATSGSFTITTAASTTTSGNVTIYPPLVITATSHGLSNGATVVVGVTPSANWNPYYTYTVYGATTNTFQIQNSSSPTANMNISSAATTLPQLGTTAYTWTKPTNCKKVLVQLVGGGGGTGDTGNALGTGAGYSQELIDVTSVSTVSVTVGAVGVTSYQTLSSTYTNGGTTSFGAYCSATGGAKYTGSGATVFDSISVAGLGSGGDLNLRGFISNSQMGTGALPASSGGSLVGTVAGYGAGGASVSGCGQATTQGTGGAVFVTEYY